jgi:hypothetical protein
MYFFLWHWKYMKAGFVHFRSLKANLHFCRQTSLWKQSRSKKKKSMTFYFGSSTKDWGLKIYSDKRKIGRIYYIHCYWQKFTKLRDRWNHSRTWIVFRVCVRAHASNMYRICIAHVSNMYQNAKLESNCYLRYIVIKVST